MLFRLVFVQRKIQSGIHICYLLYIQILCFTVFNIPSQLLYYLCDTECPYDVEMILLEFQEISTGSTFGSLLPNTGNTSMTFPYSSLTWSMSRNLSQPIFIDYYPAGPTFMWANTRNLAHSCLLLLLPLAIVEQIHSRQSSLQPHSHFQFDWLFYSKRQEEHELLI